MEVREDYGQLQRADTGDFREIPAGLAALMDTLGSLEAEWNTLAERLSPVLAPQPDEKMAEELRIGPSSEIAATLANMELRISRIRNSIYDVARRVQL